jgi:hypothetical protein
MQTTKSAASRCMTNHGPSLTDKSCKVKKREPAVSHCVAVVGVPETCDLFVRNFAQ